MASEKKRVRKKLSERERKIRRELEEMERRHKEDAQKHMHPMGRMAPYIEYGARLLRGK